jgi:hypothetical protein
MMTQQYGVVSEENSETSASGDLVGRELLRTAQPRDDRSGPGLFEISAVTIHRGS